MTPAEKRIKGLLDRWLTSIELHLQYIDLSDEAYWEIQAWPKHDRPTRWVLELAKQKALDLKQAFEARQQMGDSKFADALELMSFLANLVGAQHVDRFIPIAEPRDDVVMPKPISPVAAKAAPASADVPSWYAQAVQPMTAPKQQPQAKPSPPVAPASAPSPPPVAARPAVAPPAAPVKPKPAREMEVEPTREMPKLRVPPVATTASVNKPAAAPAKSKTPPRANTPKPAVKAPAAGNESQEVVIADAIRLLTWGRTWHELADLIARMADRPPAGEIRKILRANRPHIEKTAKESGKSSK